MRSLRIGRRLTSQVANTKQLVKVFSMTDKELARFKSQDPNIEKFTKVLPAVHNAAPRYNVINEGNKETTGKTSHANNVKEKGNMITKKELDLHQQNLMNDCIICRM